MIFEGFNKILSMEFIEKQVIYDRTLGKAIPIVKGSSAGDAKEKLGLGNVNFVIVLPVAFFAWITFVISVLVLYAFFRLCYSSLSKKN